MATHASRATHAASGERRISILKIVGALTLLVLIGWLILGNTDSVAVTLWWAEVNIPMWIALLATFLGGWAFGILVHLWRAKRPAVRSQR